MIPSVAVRCVVLSASSMFRNERLHHNFMKHLEMSYWYMWRGVWKSNISTKIDKLSTFVFVPQTKDMTGTGNEHIICIWYDQRELFIARGRENRTWMGLLTPWQIRQGLHISIFCFLSLNFLKQHFAFKIFNTYLKVPALLWWLKMSLWV